ncbi:MAG: hypothetical protein HFJ54_09300 [Clostridia bacterium]|jgi:hypothetical protein|nr:hypothetical protein [Clostridia bacterium]
MKKNKKIITTLVVTVIVIVGVILILEKLSNNQENKGNQYKNDQEENKIVEKYVKELEDGTKINISNKLNETKSLDGLEISNIQLTYKNGISVILADVRNTTNQDIELTPINLKLYDEQGNILETLDGLISKIKATEKTQLNIGVSNDFANAYDFTIEKK